MRTNTSFLKQVLEYIVVFEGIAIISQYSGLELRNHFSTLQLAIISVSIGFTFLFIKK